MARLFNTSERSTTYHLLDFAHDIHFNILHNADLRPKKRQQKMARRKEVGSLCPKNGHGKKRRRFSKSQMLRQQTKLRYVLSYQDGLHWLRNCPQIEWKSPDVDGLIQFLVTEKGFK